MLQEIGVYGRSSATPSDGSTSARRTKGVARRAAAALEAGLFVIACVGELEEERERGETEDVLRRQVSVLEPHENLVVAYEPVWAIGTGKTATPEIAQEAHAFVKSLLDVPVLYGGSVKPENAAELLAQPDVDGALVGGASLEVESFARICEAAPPRSARHPRRLGLRPAGTGKRGRACGHARVRPALGGLPAHDARRLRRSGRAAARARWGTPRWAT